MHHTTEDKLKPLPAAGQLLDCGESEQELITQIRQGDRMALDILFERYSPAVIRRVARKVSDHELDDVVQEVFKEFLEQCRKGNGPDKSIAAYLGSLARAAVGRVLRERLQGAARSAKENGGRRRPAVDGVQAILDRPDDDITFDEKVTGDIWAAIALAELDEDELLVFEMYLDKCNWNSIAQELISRNLMAEGKTPIEAARSRFRRAREKLRIFYEGTR
jgi:RNA polymerase sigma factor (sigma-70 family)